MMGDEKETEMGPVEKKIRSIVEADNGLITDLIKNGEDSKVTGES